ncbi:MAG TPA: hypothetical protein VHG52_12005 [Thermomicrobiales bacterium]|nr:hypothetical protein [Thermomicrobiales bacterium]
MALTFLLMASFVAQGLDWSPALAATCEIPAAAASSQDRLPAAASASTPTAGTGSSIIEIEGADEPGATTPVSVHEATPVQPTPDPVELLGEELTAVAESLAACLSTGDAETVTELAAERYLGQLFGSSVPFSRDEYVAIASELTPVPTRIVSLEEVTLADDDRAMALVTQVVGNQLLRAEWTFEPAPSGERRAGESRWRLAGERQQPVPAPPGAEPIDVEIGERSFTLDEPTVTGPDVVLNGSNVSDEDHEMLVLRLASGYTTADLLRASGPDLPQEVTFIGAATVTAGDERNLVLVDLEPGTYTLVCLFPDPDGIPHLAQGMEASFTVE